MRQFANNKDYITMNDFIFVHSGEKPPDGFTLLKYEFQDPNGSLCCKNKLLLYNTIRNFDEMKSSREAYEAKRTARQNEVLATPFTLADVVYQDTDGMTLLHYAAYWGNQRVAEVLLSHKADPNVRNRYGFSCLLLAAFESHTNVGVLLVQKGADGRTRCRAGGDLNQYASGQAYTAAITNAELVMIFRKTASQTVLIQDIIDLTVSYLVDVSLPVRTPRRGALRDPIIESI